MPKATAPSSPLRSARPGAVAISRTAVHRADERGIALVMALIMLLLITLVGLSSIRTATVQERISGNFYDRQLAFQEAEASLEAAGAALRDVVVDGNGKITRDPTSKIIDCTIVPSPCTHDPFMEPGVAAHIITGTGTQQYVIEYLGLFAAADPNGSTSTGYTHTGTSQQEGLKPSVPTSPFFRVTARNGDQADLGLRATATLQATFKQ